MACAESLTTSFTPSCSAIKKVGGFQNFGYLLTVDDLASISVTTGNIDSLTFDSSKVAIKFTTKEKTVTAESPILDEGEGNITLVTHTVNLPIYFDTQAELNEADVILQSDRVAAILPTANNQFRVYGLTNDTTNYNFENFGMKVTGGADAPGQNLNDVSRLNITLTGNMPNLPCFFGVGTFATDLATLDGYLTNP